MSVRRARCNVGDWITIRPSRSYSNERDFLFVAVVKGESKCHKPGIQVENKFAYDPSGIDGDNEPGHQHWPFDDERFIFEDFGGGDAV